MEYHEVIGSKGKNYQLVIIKANPD
jgi:hypothetical protein